MNDRQIISRFFLAIRKLIDLNIIRGVATFTSRYNINRWNFMTLEKYMEKLGIFKVEWLAYLCDDYKVNPMWVLTGRGCFFIDGFDAFSVQNLQKTCKQKTKVCKPIGNQAITN